MRIFLLGMLMLLSSEIFAQDPVWGWAPQVTVSASNDTIVCNVVDPTNGQLKQITKTGVLSYSNSEGVVTWSNSNTTYAMVYDRNLHDWVWYGWYAPYQLTNSDGIVSMQSGAYTYIALYDPIIKTWQWERWSATNAIVVNDGIVVIQSDTETIALIYDANSHTWVSESWFIVGDILLEQGVITLQNASQLFVAIFDHVKQNWIWNTWYLNGAVINKNGVVAFQNGTEIFATVYDLERRQWQWDSWQETGNISIVDGTLLINDNGTISRKGFDISSNTWKNDIDTDLVCELHVSTSVVNDTMIMHLNYMAIGASSNTFTFSNGDTVSIASAWKQFDQVTDQYISLEVGNNTDVSVCNLGVDQAGMPVGIHKPMEKVQASLYPNPTTGTLYLKGLEVATELHVYNSYGELVGSYHVNDSFTMDVSHLATGIYFVMLPTNEGGITHRFVKQ